MKFTLSVAMNPLDQFTGLARTAEECGFLSIALPDSLFYSEHVSAEYPYTPDGSRFWTADTPWADPLVAVATMAAVTERIGYYTSVLKLGSRNPVLLARQVGSVAVLSGNRFGLGLGVGWSSEEFEWCGAPYANRGKRVDEAIEVLRLILDGGVVEYHGEFFDFDKLQMSPAPSEHVPFYEVRRPAFDHRAAFAAARGVRAGRRAVTQPWVFEGVGFGDPVGPKMDAIRRFGDEIISRF